MNKYVFELNDGEITRQGYFKKISMADGLKIMSLAEKMTNKEPDAVSDFVEIAVKYLVLVIPETAGEQNIHSLSELDAIFNNPFLSIKIAEEFENYIAPYLESLNLSQNKITELKRQAQK